MIYICGCYVLSLLKLPCNPTLYIHPVATYFLSFNTCVFHCEQGHRHWCGRCGHDRTTFLVKVTFYEVKWYAHSSTLVVCMARAVNSEDIGDLPLQPFMTQEFTLRSHQKQAQSIVMQKYSSAQGPTQIFSPTIVPADPGCTIFKLLPTALGESPNTVK